MRVAILDDHRAVRESLARALTAEGIEVSAVCEDPEQFLERVRQDAPGAALIDLALSPDESGSPRSGLDVIRQLRAQAPAFRAVVLTGNTDPARVADCYREGAAGYLFKSQASVTGIVAALEAVGRGERVFPSGMLESLQAAQAAHPPDAAARLTHRERQVLALITQGHDNLKIGALLDIGERTVKTHISALYRKLRVENRVQLALLGQQLGLGAAS